MWFGASALPDFSANRLEACAFIGASLRCLFDRLWVVNKTGSLWLII